MTSKKTWMPYSLSEEIEFEEELRKARGLIEVGYEHIMRGLERMGYPVKTDPNFHGTDRRAAKGFGELVLPPSTIVFGVDRHLKATFPSEHDEMITVPNIPAAGVCPHHLLPVRYRVTVSYIPGEYIVEENGEPVRKAGQYRVLGLSKIPRIVQVVARQPLMQESYAQQLADIFSLELNVQGVGISILGWHTCMECRGVEMSGEPMLTNAVRGVYTGGNAKSEFLTALQKLQKV